jgi:UDP-N-acetylglucosamine 2-epimerase
MWSLIIELGVRKLNLFLDVVGASLAESVGNDIAKMDLIFDLESPEAVLILGDTNSALSAYPAKRHKIPIFHMEAGNRCFDFRVPEKINRRLVDHLSDINLPFQEHARRNLLAEGIPTDQINCTGSPHKEVIDFHIKMIEQAKPLETLGLDVGNYLVVSIYREENVDNPKNLMELVTSLNSVAENYNIPMIFSCHPRSRKKLKETGYQLNKLIRQLPPLGIFDYNHLQLNSFCTISDIGTIGEESAILGFPAVTARQVDERLEGMDEGVLVMAGLSARRILDAIVIVRKQFQLAGPVKIPVDYNVDQVSL